MYVNANRGKGKSARPVTDFLLDFSEKPPAKPMDASSWKRMKTAAKETAAMSTKRRSRKRNVEHVDSPVHNPQ